MTEISFHFNVPERTGYACRLLRKAVRQGASVVATGPAERLDALDRELWTFEADEFVPHARVALAAEVPARLHERTVWLAAQAIDTPAHGVLVNLGDAVPGGFESYDRVVEIVTADADDRAAARERWKRYAARGYALRGHEVGE